MIYILHGEDTFTSRKKLNELIEKSEKTIRLDLKKTPVNLILQAFEDSDLFLEKKSIVLEGILKSTDGVIEQVNKESEGKTTDVIIWSHALLDAKTLSAIKKPVVFNFPLPKPIFAFLDSLTPAFEKNTLQNFSEALKYTTDELLFYSIIKRIRLLLLFKTGKIDMYQDTKYLKPWQIGKLKKQADSWDIKELERIYSKLFDLEVLLKTSSLPLGLSKHLDILLTGSLN